MNQNKIKESITFLLQEYKRLKKKEQKDSLNKIEKEILKKISIFVEGKEKDK